MATEAHAASGGGASSGVMDKGLKKGAIGYVSNIVIGVASTAPAYSLAATLGFIAADNGVGTHAPAVLLASFIPMLLVALGYRYLNRADPDAGTAFAWTTRAFGPARSPAKSAPASARSRPPPRPYTGSTRPSGNETTFKP